MAPQLTALFLLTGSLGVVTLAVVMYAGFSRAETRFTLVVTLLLGFVVLTDWEATAYAGYVTAYAE